MIGTRVKDYLPRSLYGRATLILIVPVLTLLAVMSVVFIQRLYEDVTHQMTDAVAAELSLVLQRINAAAEPDAGLEAALEVAEPLGIRLRYDDAPVVDAREAIDLSGATVIATLRESFPNLSGVDLVTANNAVVIQIESVHGPVVSTIPRLRFSARNPHQFLVLIGFTALLMTLIALLYLRGQVRPIRRLAAAASAFGKGRVVQYRPTGAAEVREAGQAFLEMRDRIERQIEQRTMMLSGVSHDLRTPLTRMRLAVDMSDDRDTANELSRDIVEMERMLTTFLDFARLDLDAEMEEVDFNDLAQASIDKFVRSGHTVEFKPSEYPAELRAQPMAVSRALENLISNAVRYGSSARVSIEADGRHISLIVEDDGPGIAEEQRKAAEKPFSRLDAARNQDAGSGVGLGLAIVKDIARQHGGQLILGVSESLGGLRAEIFVPV